MTQQRKNNLLRKHQAKVAENLTIWEDYEERETNPLVYVGLGLAVGGIIISFLI